MLATVGNIITKMGLDSGFVMQKQILRSKGLACPEASASPAAAEEVPAGEGCPLNSFSLMQ